MLFDASRHEPLIKKAWNQNEYRKYKRHVLIIECDNGSSSSGVLGAVR